MDGGGRWPYAGALHASIREGLTVAMALSSAIALAVSFVVSFAASSTGAVFRPGAWYAGLRKPGWTPPNWAFPVVWTALFSAMAVSAWMVWETAGMAAWPALALYVAHLAVNAVWSCGFFGLKRLDWAMAEVLCLWLMIAAVIAAFATISVPAALLLAPYLAWVSIAALLNYRLLQLNGPRGTGAQAA
jgi:benzodiazapine receptor